MISSIVLVTLTILLRGYDNNESHHYSTLSTSTCFDLAAFFWFSVDGSIVRKSNIYPSSTEYIPSSNALINIDDFRRAEEHFSVHLYCLSDIINQSPSGCMAFRSRRSSIIKLYASSERLKPACRCW